MERLSSYPFRDQRRAGREMRTLALALPQGIQDRLDLLLAACPAPELALHAFTRLREHQPTAFERLMRSAAGLHALTAIFSQSRFLTEELLQHPDWSDDLLDIGQLQRPIPVEDLRARLLATLPPGVPQPIGLARFRRRQILRIVARDVLALGTLPEIAAELTALADTLVGVAYERIYADLTAHYGPPGSSATFSVIALGKMGGEELNYSSDIDLIFLYSANGETTGRRTISNKEFFTRASHQLTALLSAFTGEGMCYRVDLRLRPDGGLGEVCISLEGAKQYYAQRARDWELQMMIKARVAAGDKETGRALLDFVEPLTYGSTLDFKAVEQMSATRERLNEKLAAKQSAKKGIDLKLDRGGIRDIEFLVQCLQRLHGGADSWVRHGGTLLALARLHDKGHLSDSEYGRLASAYQFLRHLEHRLQFDEDRQTHTLPEDAQQVEWLARRMPLAMPVDDLLAELRTHLDNVKDLYERVVLARSASETPSPGRQAANVVQALDQTAPQLASALAMADLQRGRRSFEHFLERISSDPARLQTIDGDSALTASLLDLFEHSPHFAEELIRTPELADDIARASRPLSTEEPTPHEAPELRRWYRREMLRIQAESICQSHPIFDTLLRTSHLADAVIERAYGIAVAEMARTHAFETPGYEPAGQMFVIGLGRLGMQEFDLASDADLVFVLADSDAAEMAFWTKVAHRLQDLIMAYTGSGVMFSVDTRLRPNGTAGPMVQTEAAFREYFETSAEAWEGITYMKSRGIAGDAKRTGEFLNAIQAVDWRRYGQGGRSRTDLRQMRARLEKEQGASSPLKAGRGGYYDIDFLLMYLRLKSAGVFFAVLNTPARIEVLEILGHLSKQQAAFLRDAATFYRALDHALRVTSGHAEGKLPKSDASLELVAEVLKRWTPIPLSDLDRVRKEIRALFNRFFD